MSSKNILDPFKPKDLTIRSLRKIKFKYSDEYQRSGIIWSPPKKQKLIDSILRNYHIGTMVLIKRGKNYFEVIDGQQRLRTIQEFMKQGCKWRTAKYSPVQNKSYKEIKKDDTFGPNFDGYKIYYIPIPTTAEDEQICDIFIRLQEGVPTNTPEKLNAMKGEMRNLTFKLKDLNFFKKTSIKEYRFSYREILAHIALMELEFLNKNIFPNFPNLRLQTLKNMYEKKEIPRFLERSIRRAFNFMNSSFENSAKFIENKGDFLQVYLLASLLSTKYSIREGTKKIFGSFFKKFLSETIRVKSEIKDMKEGEIEKDPIKKYASIRSKGQTRENLEKKFTILTTELFKKLSKLEPKPVKKDEKRDFDFCQKIFVYYVKDQETCQRDKSHVGWEDSSFHHKEFHSNGGPTTIKNCQLLCKKCHVDLHKTKKDTTEV